MKGGKLKILIITSASDDPKPAWLLAREIKKMGHEVEIVAPDKGEVSIKANEFGIKVHIIKLPRRETENILNRIFIAIKFILKVRYLCNTNNYDIINLNLGRARILGRIAALGTGVKIVSTIHGQDPAIFKGFLLEKLTNWLDNATVAISSDTYTYFSSFGFSKNRLFVIYNGIDLEEIDAVPKKVDYLYQELSLPKEIPIIGMIAHFYPSQTNMDIKGHKIFIRAAMNILENYKRVHFIIAGTDKQGGNYKAAVEEYARKLRLSSHIHFLGLRNDVANILDSLYCLVLPSIIREGFGMVLIEAMARGIPVIGSNIGGIPEIIEDGKTGILIKPGDPEDLAHAVLFMLNNPQKASQMGGAGRKRVEEKFSSVIMARNYELLFYQLSSSEILKSNTLKL
jgi:glycosyltransferase involved in cell wall biosynthesis